MKGLLLLILLTIATSGFGINASDSSGVPKFVESQLKLRPQLFVPIQFAGNIGWFSTGIGYSAKRDLYQLSFVYGYVPEQVAGIDIHTVTARNIFHLYRLPLNEQSVLIPYAAAGVSLEVGGRSFFTLPDNMSPGYYGFPKSLHLIPAIGCKLRRATPRRSNLKGVELFAEVTTVDVYIWYKTISREVRMPDILSASAGIHFFPGR
ncbi:MAG TPA: hypothetical protein VD927_06770 [Chryseosolibacter sp.]|nr:hypothetical protein [Chryseosolibacter sp.]